MAPRRPAQSGSEAARSLERNVTTALVTGIMGQDGSYLAELLLAKGYRVVGLTRAADRPWPPAIAHLDGRVELRAGDLRSEVEVERAVAEVAPDELYHLAAQSVPHASWEKPLATADVNAIGALRVLEAVRTQRPSARVLMASSCEIFGAAEQSPQSESTPIRPATPYGVSKAFAFWMTAAYRETHRLFAASAILYNHESPRRGPVFVSRKIAEGVALIARGRQRELQLGNLEARRDWGFAGDYVDAMWRIVQHDIAEDFVIGTGESHSVREFCEEAFRAVGLDYRNHVVVDRALLRPVDAAQLVADSTRAHERLGWRPTVGFAALVQTMVGAELARVTGESA